MQKMAGYARKAITEYQMIAPGDHIAVGVSGGKDSVVLLCALHMLQSYLGIPYRLSAVTLDPCFGGVPGDYSAIEALCSRLEIPYRIQRTQIAQIIFEERKETNPCSLCARMRRGALHDLCRELGANKLALGHNWNDAVETFVMNLFGEGRLGCFSPVTWLSRKELTVIRPLIYAPEKEILGAVRQANLPIVASLCPADKDSRRQEVKDWLAKMDRSDHSFSKKLFGAMKRAHLSDW